MAYESTNVWLAGLFRWEGDIMIAWGAFVIFLIAFFIAFEQYKENRAIMVKYKGKLSQEDKDKLEIFKNNLDPSIITKDDLDMLENIANAADKMVEASNDLYYVLQGYKNRVASDSLIALVRGVLKKQIQRVKAKLDKYDLSRFNEYKKMLEALIYNCEQLALESENYASAYSLISSGSEAMFINVLRKVINDKYSALIEAGCMIQDKYYSKYGDKAELYKELDSWRKG